MMILADEDGDGNINYEEFISMLFKVGVTQATLLLGIHLFFQRPHGQIPASKAMDSREQTQHGADTIV